MAGERFQDNPSKITRPAIDTTFRLLSGNHGEDLSKFQGRLNHAPFADIFHGEFEVFRMGSLGWRIGISQPNQEQFGTKLDELTPLGPEGENYDNFDHASWDYTVGVELVRAVIVNSFVEQAGIDGKPLPVMNNGIIDSPPFERELLGQLEAPRPGMTVMVVEDLDAQMKLENPDLYAETMKFKDGLVDRFTPRTVGLYQKEPAALLTHFTPQIRHGWETTLKETALRTYGWFTPNQPNLFQVPVKP